MPWSRPAPASRPAANLKPSARSSDLAATFLDYANVKKPATMDSRSLRPLLTGRTKVLRSHLVSALEEWRLVWDGRHKLFDLQSDPLENSNLWAQQSKIWTHLKTILPG